MPSWCSNYVFIDASEELQKKIANFVRSEESDFDFEKIIPMPENIYRGNLGQEEKELYGENNWYEWRTRNWGTKWNSRVREATPEKYSFQTAWTPCEPVIARLARIFPEALIIHTYEAEDALFYGADVYEQGKLVYRMAGDYFCDPSAENPELWDEDSLEAMKIEDDLYPLQQTGDIFEKTEDDHIHMRFYKNGRLYVKIDAIREVVDGQEITKFDRSRLESSSYMELDSIRQLDGAKLIYLPEKRV